MHNSLTSNEEHNKDITKQHFHIPFTQYMLHDGARRHNDFMTKNADVYHKAQDILKAGYKFEIEVLRTGQVSASIYDPKIESDVVIEIMQNGIDVVNKIEAMILNFNPKRGKAADATT